MLPVKTQLKCVPCAHTITALAFIIAENRQNLWNHKMFWIYKTMFIKLPRQMATVTF